MLLLSLDVPFNMPTYIKGRLNGIKDKGNYCLNYKLCWFKMLPASFLDSCLSKNYGNLNHASVFSQPKITCIYRSDIYLLDYNI